MSSPAGGILALPQRHNQTMATTQPGPRYRPRNWIDHLIQLAAVVIAGATIVAAGSMPHAIDDHTNITYAHTHVGGR